MRLFLVLASTVLSASPGPQARPHAYLSPPEIIKAMEASPTSFTIRALSELGGSVDPLETMYPQVRPKMGQAVVVSLEGKRQAQEFACSKEAEALIAKAEVPFQAKRYAEAEALYRQALAKQPECYEAWASLGECAQYAGDTKAALERYEKAITGNPDEYRTWFYKGDALHREGRESEAVEAFTTSLVLYPRNPVLREYARRAQKLSVAMQDDLFRPKALVREEGDGVAIYFNPKDGAHWLAWASCKALWLGDENHRKVMNGSTDLAFSTTQELECLNALLVSYVSQRKLKKAEADLAVERLLPLADGSNAAAFVAYELASRVDPQATLPFDRSARESLRIYIKKFVLTRRPKE